MANQDGFGVTVVGATTGAIGNLIDVQPPGVMREKVDTSVHAMAGGWETSEPAQVQSLPDTTLTMFFEKGKQTTLMTAIRADAEVWTVTFKDGSAWSCSGYILQFEGDAIPLKDHIKQSLTFAWTGEPSWTPA